MRAAYPWELCVPQVGQFHAILVDVRAQLLECKQVILGHSVFTRSLQQVLTALSLGMGAVLGSSRGMQLLIHVRLAQVKCRHHGELGHGTLPSTFARGWTRECSFSTVSGCLFVLRVPAHSITKAVGQLVDWVLKGPPSSFWLPGFCKPLVRPWQHAKACCRPMSCCVRRGS